MNFNFGEVLTRAWQIIWKHKVLWIFGIFAGCGRGSGGGGGGGGGGGTGPGTQPFPELERMFQQIGQWIEENPWIVAVAVILGLALVVLSIFLGTIGRIGLIKGTYQAETGAERLNFGELFSNSMPYFWRVFGLSLLIFLIALLVFVPFALFGALTAGIGFLCALPLICILVPVLWAVSVVIEQANAAIVLDNLGIGDGLRKGWEVVRANVGPIILLSLIIFIGSGILGFIIAIPIIAAVFPLIFSAASNNANTAWITAVCCAVYFPILLVLSGILNSYVQSVWTLTYMRLTAKPQDNAPVVLEANA
ncbi:MAG: DUF7847 domain-containing protein [Anaerolineales bacterium]